MFLLEDDAPEKAYWSFLEAHAQRKERRSICLASFRVILCCRAEDIVASVLISCSLSHVDVMCPSNVHLLHAEGAFRRTNTSSVMAWAGSGMWGLKTATLPAEPRESAAAAAVLLPTHSQSLIHLLSGYSRTFPLLLEKYSVCQQVKSQMLVREWLMGPSSIAWRKTHLKALKRAVCCVFTCEAVDAYSVRAVK